LGQDVEFNLISGKFILLRLRKGRSKNMHQKNCRKAATRHGID